MQDGRKYSSSEKQAAQPASQCHVLLTKTIFALSLLAVLGLPTSALAGNELEQRWQERHDATTAHTSAAAKTATARSELAAIDQHLRTAANRLAKDNETYLDVTRRYYAVLGELEEKYAERLEAEAVPELLSAQRRELRRQYDILAEYRNYVDDSFFKELETNLRNTIKQIAESRQTGRKRITDEIDPAIKRLQEKKSELIRELDRLSRVDYDSSLTTRWFNAAQDLYEAEQSQLDAANSAEDRTSAFITTLAEASPPFLQRVRVIADNQKFYDFSWIREGYDDDVTASIEYARQRDQLAEALPSYIQILKTIKLERSELHLDRWQLAMQMHALSTHLTNAAENYRSAQFNKVAVLAITEIAITLAEVAATGGVATALRRGEELTQKAVQAATRNTDPLLSIVKKHAPGHVRLRLRTTLDSAAQRQFDELFEATNRQRQKFIKREIEKEVLPILLQRGEGLHKTLAEASAKVPSSKLDPIVQQVSRNVEYRANQLFPEPDYRRFVPADEIADHALQSVLQKAESEATNAINLRGPVELGAIIAKQPDLYATYIPDHNNNPLSPSTEPTDVGEIFSDKAVEWAVGTGINGATELGRRSWSSAETIAKHSKVGSFGRQASMGAVFSAVDGSAKAIISTYYDNKISENHKEFWGIYAQLTAMHQYYYKMLKADEELVPMERDYRNGIMRTRAYLDEIGLPRHPGGEIQQPQIIPPNTTSVTIELDFSTPLTVPPIVHLGEDTLEVEGSGRQWHTTVEISQALRQTGKVQLSVAAGEDNQTYNNLDTDPQTIAYIPVDNEEWIGYERGADTMHNLIFVSSPLATGCADGTREGFVKQNQFPGVAACGGNWGGSIEGHLAANLCASGWSVCNPNTNPHHAAILKSVSMAEATSFGGCYPYAAANDFGRTQRCTGQQHADDMAGTGNSCKKFPNESSILANGRVDSVCCSNFSSPFPCGQDPNQPHTNGVTCCQNNPP